MKFKELVFTKTAAARILGCQVQQIKRLEVWASVVFLIVEGRRPTFVSHRAFKRDFTEFRRCGAQWLENSITPHLYSTNQFSVRSVRHPDRDFYTVTYHPGLVECTCADFAQQRETFGNRPKACKHSLAVLQFKLGFDSLADYVKATTSSGQPREPAVQIIAGLAAFSDDPPLPPANASSTLSIARGF